MRYEIRQLEVGGVLDQAINLTKDNFALFFKIALVLFLCSACIQLLTVWTGPMATVIPAVNPAEMPKVQWAPSGAILVTLVLMLVSFVVVRPLTNGAIIYAVASCYLGMPINVGIAFRRAWRVYLPMVLTGILAFVLFALGYALCLVPGIILAFRFAFVTQVVVIEGVTGPAALTRSRELMKTNWWNAFVLGILVIAISLGLLVIQRLVPQQELAVIVGSALQTALFIFATAALVVFYFSCRCKLENFDLVMLANAVGADDPPAEGMTLAE